ncbi:MAG TPA: thioesterase [Chloroflexi bacterium]|nr:thioesterase [Chloroflexota bacterium]
MNKIELHPGLVGDVQHVVQKIDTAAYLGSGTLDVLATPALVQWMEQAAVQAIAEHLPTGQTSVGGHIDVQHVAPTPVGLTVRVQAVLSEMVGRRLTFHIEAWDEDEQVGIATHDRFLVDEKAFITHAQAKIQGKARRGGS